MNTPSRATNPLANKFSRPRWLKNFGLKAGLALLALAGGFKSQAANDTWDGSVNGVWATSGNWLTDPLVVPGTGETATFNNAGNGFVLIDLGAGVTISNLLFDTASAAAYTIGTGGAGGQTLTLNHAGGITLGAGLANDQVINALLRLPSETNATTVIGNPSTRLLTLGGGISSIPTNGNSLLTIANAGDVAITGALTETGVGNLALLKTGAGRLTISANGGWSGNAAVGRIPTTSAGFPLVAREGTLLFNGGSNFVNGELVIGGVVADGGAGQNARIIVDGSTLNLSSWFSIGRGNGIGGVSSDLILTNAATVIAGNLSAGFNGSGAGNFPKGSITMGSTSTFTITGNGAVNFGESLGSDFTWNLNDSAQFIAAGTGLKHLGQNGRGTVNLNGGSSMILGNANTYVGRTQGTGSSTGILNMASSGTLSVAGELRVGGSQDNGAGRIAYGTLNISSGTVNLGALVVGRGNNNQNQCFGDVSLTGGIVTITNDLVIGFAGLNNYGKVTLAGSTVNVGPLATKWLMVGRWDTTAGQLDINSGVLNLMNNTSIKMNADGTIAPNVVNQNGGSINFYSDAGTNFGGTGDLDLQRAGAAASVNTYNLNGGTLTVPRISSTATSGSRTFNFNGGTLRAAASSPTFLSLPANGLSRINVRNGGAIIDANGKDITIVQSLDHSDVGGDAAVDGGLVKSGAGILTLAGGSTYTGPTVITGGGLSVSPAAFSYSATSMVFSNAVLAADVFGGGTSLTPTSLTLQNNAGVTLNYGGLSGNPSAPGINVSGALSAPGTGLTITITGVGFKPGTVTLIDYTGSALPNLANFSLVLPPGVSATLVNNTGNTSIDLLITTAPQNLTWYGTNANWDINTTYNYDTATLKYLEYGSAPNAVGDAVTFNDSLFNDFVNPQNTNVNLTTALSSFPVTVDSTLGYIFSGPGQLVGVASLVKSNTGTLTLTTSNSYGSGTFIYGGSIAITNENALGAAASKLTLGGGNLQVTANATNTSRAVSVIGSSTLGVASGANYQVGGVISGVGNLSKIDTGTMILSGSNGITGNLTVDQGTMRNTGNQTLPAIVRVGNTASQDGVLTVSGGTFRADNNAGQFASGLIAGATAGSAGVINLSGGTLVVRQQLGLGAGAGGYGALNYTGGTLNCGSYIVVGFNNDRAVYNQTAGTVTISSNLMTIAAGGTGSRGVANFSGGTFNSTFGLSSGIMVGERGVGVMNVSGSAAINLTTNAGMTIGPVAAQTGWDGQLNMNGGTVTANRVVKGLGTGVGKISLNGGTLKAAFGSTAFVSGLDSAVVYSGGAVFDDSGFSLTVPQALQAPTDFGVNSISVGVGGSGYLDAPIVVISGGSGSNATAIATVSGGAVTAVTVTCRGSGYSSGDVLTVDFVSGGANVTAASASANLTANVSGGLVKRGSGTLNLIGANTYSGSNHVAAGNLLLSPAHQVAGQPVGVASNAAFGVLANAGGAAMIGNLTFGATTVDRHSLAIALAAGNPVSPVLQCGTLTLNGTNTIRLSGTVSAGIIPLVQYTGAIAGSGVFNAGISLPQGLAGSVSNYVAGSILYAVITGTPGIVWTGTNSAAALTNVWNINGATNWLAAGLPTFYMETNAPGDPVTFNDVGSGVVLLSNTVSPGSVTISNNARSYAFSGTGRISGSTGLSKRGTGSATVAVANDYSGPTTIVEGILRLGSGTAIPDGVTASGVVVNSGGALDLNGFSETINGLSGGGFINNAGAAGSTLTVGNGNSGGTWSGNISNTGPGTVTLIKVGTGSLTLSGTNNLGGTSQFNGGTNYLTATGRINSIGTGEFWVQQNAGSSTFIVDGGSLSVNNWFVVGRNAAGANGTLIVNGGTVTKGGPNNIVVGSLNATGLLVVNGGQVLNNGMLWLGENASANATLRLNGGLIQATQVRPNNAVASSTAYFNGGTLQASASSADFISVTTACLIQSGGLIFDSQGFGLTNASVLAEDGASPGGGLVKLGSGVLSLAGANTYSGLTIVSNGTLLVDGIIPGAATVKAGATLGGSGSISGLVTVESGGALAPGSSIGTLTLSLSPVLSAGSSVIAEVDRGGSQTADLLNLSGNPIAYNGTLILRNIGAPLQVGDTFTLFSASSRSGGFTIVSQTPGQTVTWDTSNLLVDGTVSVASVAANTTFTLNVGYSGNAINLSWPPNQLGLTLQSNSVSVASLVDWYAVAGSTTVTQMNLTVNPAQTNVFFRLLLP